jgi:hypothetical protein
MQASYPMNAVTNDGEKATTNQKPNDVHVEPFDVIQIGSIKAERTSKCRKDFWRGDQEIVKMISPQGLLDR